MQAAHNRRLPNGTKKLVQITTKTRKEVPSGNPTSQAKPQTPPTSTQQSKDIPCPPITPLDPHDRISMMWGTKKHCLALSILFVLDKLESHAELLNSIQAGHASETFSVTQAGAYPRYLTPTFQKLFKVEEVSLTGTICPSLNNKEAIGELLKSLKSNTVLILRRSPDATAPYAHALGLRITERGFDVLDSSQDQVNAPVYCSIDRLTELLKNCNLLHQEHGGLYLEAHCFESTQKDESTQTTLET